MKFVLILSILSNATICIAASKQTAAERAVKFYNETKSLDTIVDKIWVDKKETQRQVLKDFVKNNNIQFPEKISANKNIINVWISKRLTRIEVLPEFKFSVNSKTMQFSRNEEPIGLINRIGEYLPKVSRLELNFFSSALAQDKPSKDESILSSIKFHAAGLVTAVGDLITVDDENENIDLIDAAITSCEEAKKHPNENKDKILKKDSLDLAVTQTQKLEKSYCSEDAAYISHLLATFKNKVEPEDFNPCQKSQKLFGCVKEWKKKYADGSLPLDTNWQRKFWEPLKQLKNLPSQPLPKDFIETVPVAK